MDPFTLIFPQVVIFIVMLAVFYISSQMILPKASLFKATLVVFLNNVALPAIAFTIVLFSGLIKFINPFLAAFLGIVPLVILTKYFYRSSWRKSMLVAALSWIASFIVFIIFVLIYIGLGIL